MSQPFSFRERLNGVEIQVYEWPGEGPPVLLAHATGFHGRCWDQVVAHLPGRRVIAWDMRGHGVSEKTDPPYPWSHFTDDTAALLRRLAIRGAIGAGHSKGGYALVTAAAAVPGAFAKLLLVDPVIQPRDRYRAEPAMGDHFAARRRNEWASPEEMYERFKDRPPFNTWQPAVLRDYCLYGLVPNPAGEGYVLACPPAVEAATYAGSAGCDPYDAVAAIEFPVRILRARGRGPGDGGDMTGSPTAPDLARHFRQAEDVHLPEHTHFIPMEAPELVARHIRELLGDPGPGK